MNINNPFLVRLKNGESEAKLLTEAATLYVNSSGWREAAKKVGMSHQTLRLFVVKREAKLKKYNPALYDVYLEKYGVPKINRVDEIGETRAFTVEVMKSLPKKISYYDFINIMCTYKTGNLSSEELITMANSVGVDVIG